MNLNEKAAKIADELISKREKLKVGLVERENGTKIIDCGIKYEGSFEAGRLFALACLGGAAQVTVGEGKYGDLFLKKVDVKAENPAVPCLALQKAGWSIKGENFFALGSGPARVLAKKPKETFEKIGYSEASDKAVIALECSKYPPKEVCEQVANTCGVVPGNLYVLVARTASLASTVQISARALETALYKIDHLGYDVNSFVRGRASAPIAPIVGGDSKMMGITNDMIIYGSNVYLESNADIPVDDIPSSSSPAYGKPFEEIFKEAGGDFYKINPTIFAPATITIKNINSGAEKKAGKINSEIIKKSIGR